MKDDDCETKIAKKGIKRR